MQKFVIHIEDTGESYTATETRSVLEGMEALGKKGIPVGCRQGGCRRGRTGQGLSRARLR